jgi:phosphoglycerate dehydrogenase-like enzyme
MPQALAPYPPARVVENACKETVMIRILIADELSARAIEKLNEIPEFEIMENASLPPDKGAIEIKSLDAVIVRGMSQLPPAVLADAVGLKIIILTGGEPNSMDTAVASKKNIEIRSLQLFPGSSPRTAHAENQENVELEVIATLKDFFNV